MRKNCRYNIKIKKNFYFADVENLISQTLRLKIPSSYGVGLNLVFKLKYGQPLTILKVVWNIQLELATHLLMLLIIVFGYTRRK